MNSKRIHGSQECSTLCFLFFCDTSFLFCCSYIYGEKVFIVEQCSQAAQNFILNITEEHADLLFRPSDIHMYSSAAIPGCRLFVHFLRNMGNCVLHVLSSRSYHLEISCILSYKVMGWLKGRGLPLPMNSFHRGIPSIPRQ